MFEIQSIFLLPCIVLLATVATYPFICPSPAHWHLRSSILECQSDVHYTCLFNNSDDSYVEKCRKPGDVDVIRKGYKLIWSGSLNQGDCSFDRFQPINFRTNGSSSCIYLKSSCNEEGQVLANNGSGLKDAYCSCDSTRGYNFLHMPRSKDFCIPSEEDCTCYTNGSMPINNVDRTGFRLDNTPIGSSAISSGYKIRRLIVIYLALTLAVALVIVILYLLCTRRITQCKRHTQAVIRECGQHPKLQNCSSIEQPKNTDEDGTTNPVFIPTGEDRESSSVLAINNQPTQKDNQKMVGCSSINESTVDTNRVSNETSDGLLEEDGDSPMQENSFTSEQLSTLSKKENPKDVQQPTKSKAPVACSESHTGTENPNDAQQPTKSEDLVACSEFHTGTDNGKAIKYRNEGERKRLPEDNNECSEAVMNVHKNKSVTNCTNLSKEEANMDEEYQSRRMNRKEHWKDIDKLYHETTSILSIWKTIEQSSCESILIIGPDSYGKSITAAHFGFKFEEKGYELFFLSLPDEVDKILKVNERQVFVIHTLLGIVHHERDLERWENLSRSIISTTKSSNTKIIMTLSTRLYKMFEIRLCDTMFVDNGMVIDLLDEKYSLSDNDKRHILNKHKTKGHFQNDGSFDQKVLSEGRISHFFVWCNLISNNKNETLVDEMKKEKTLQEFYRKGIKTLKSKHPNQYVCLVLAVLFDGTFDVNELSECFAESPSLSTEQEKKSREKVLEIFKSCGIKCESQQIIEYQNRFDELTGTYFKKYPTESEYHIIDEIVTQAIIESYGPKNLTTLLEYASPNFIRKFVRSCQSAEVQKCLIVVTEKYREKFPKRLLEDLRHGQISNVFKNPSFQDQKFVSCFCTQLTALDSNYLKSIMIKEQKPCYMNNPIPSADSTSLDEIIECATPFHWVCKLGLKEILQKVWEKCNKSEEFFKNIPGKISPLHFAAGYGHLSVVEFLIEQMHFNIHGCQPQERKQTNLTPLAYAQQNRCNEVEKYLCSKGAHVKDASFHNPRLGRKSSTWDDKV